MSLYAHCLCIMLLTTTQTLQARRSSNKSQPCIVQGCLCSNPEVLDCSGKGLQHFDISVAGAAAELKVLKLNHNALQKVPELSLFTGIHTLDLSYNNLSVLPSGAFQSLPQLLHLDMSFNSLVLSDTTIGVETFHGLHNLKTLRMKQNERPALEFDYAALRPLNSTIEELYITGTPSFHSSFRNFSKLDTLSLGGSACNIPSLNESSQATLSHLPLRRLSARNCKIKEIDQLFLRNLRPTLKKLDLSCNHLKEFFREITLGVADSELHTLILDHINKEGGLYCPWLDAPDSEIQGLGTTPLRILSLQANQLGAQSKLNLRDICTDLIYLDISQNNFNGTAFYLTETMKGQPLPDADRLFFKNNDLQPPSLRYLGLQQLTGSIHCGGYDKRILDCNKDSYLFLEDEYSWDHNYDPDIMDFLLLREITKDHKLDFFECYLRQMCSTVDGIIDKVYQIAESKQAHVVTYQAINKTIRHLWQDTGGLTNLESYISNMRYLYVNVTTFDLRYNNFHYDNPNSQNPISSNLQIYPNNLDTLDFSHSTLGLPLCQGIKGLNYLANITCRECDCNGWSKDIFLEFPLKYLDFTKNKIGSWLRNDINGDVLGSAPGLETLLIGEQLKGGIQYFQDFNFFSKHANLTHLDLHSNKLISWNVTIANNSKLAFIDLRDNKVSNVEEPFRIEIDRQHQHSGLEVYLSGNDVSCTESYLDYISWLLDSPATVDAEEIECIQMDMTIEEYYNQTLHPTSSDSFGPTAAPSTVHIATIVVTATIVLAVLILLAIGWINRYVIVYRCYNLNQQKPNSYVEGQEKLRNISVFASYPKQFTDHYFSLVDELDDSRINLVSREQNILPGLMIRASVAKLIAQSEKVVIFLTPDYLKDGSTKFEFEIIKGKGLDKVVLVTIGVDSPAQLKHLPNVLKEIIANEQHIVWPTGLCAGGLGNLQAFLQTLKHRMLCERPESPV